MVKLNCVKGFVMITMLDMPKRDEPTKDEQTVSVSIRMPVALRDKLLAIGARTDFDLTLTQLLNRAAREFVEREEPRKR